MRARVYSNGGNSTGGFTFNGGTLTGALFLAGNPSEPLEAASKQYLDSSLVNLNASNISSGILPSGRLPSFVGDLVKPAGSSTINLAPNGVVAGEYIKPTVDAKGRVTGGSHLVETDIPNLSWDKIINRPTTLTGYGISNAIPLSGGTLTGFLSFSGAVTGNLQAVTKQYIDTTLSSASGISIGDIIRKPYNTTPAGFLKCNGAEVNKTTYNSLYATIGDRFSKKSLFTSGKPWEQQYTINQTQSKDIDNWSNTLTAIFSSHGAGGVIVTKNRVYFIGGNTGADIVSAVYTALINLDGTLGTWVTTTSFPTPILNPCTFIIKNRVYVCGGFNNTNAVNTVYSATINADGTIGTWVAGTAMPGVVYSASFVVTNSKVYIISGALANLSGSQSNKIYSANINSDGTLSSWTTETNAPFFKQTAITFVTKNRVYICGGSTSLYTDPVSNTVYSATINADGTLGAWVVENPLPYGVKSAAVYVTKNCVYIFGGSTVSNTATNLVLMAKINADGTIGSWGAGTQLPLAIASSQLIATKNKIYLITGATGAGAQYTVLSANISGGLNDYSSYYSADSDNYLMPGSGQPWRQQYQTNTTQSADITGWATGTALPGVLGNSQAIVTKNRVYLLGGYNSIYTSIVYTAPINSDGTLGTWTTGTSLPGALAYSQAIVTKNRVYLLGGHNGVYTSTVYTAPINSDGTLGTWATDTALPAALASSQAIVTKNRVYLLGGYNGTTYLATVYTAVINTDGTLGTWSTATSLPAALAHAQAIVTKNRVYLIGGFNGAYVNIVYTATINSDGLLGPWSTGTALPSIVSHTVSIVTNNKVYLLSRIDGNNWTPVVHIAPINADGTLGTWTTGTSLPGILIWTQAIVTNNHVYMLGGHNSGSYVNTVYTASILGGSNDYSTYYDGTVTPIVVVDPSTTFALPDLSQSEKFDTVSYIKY